MATVTQPDVIRFEALPGRVVFGVGAISELPLEIDRLHARRVLLVDGLVDGTVAEHAQRGLGARHAQTISVLRQHVPAELATEVEQAAHRAGVDCLLSIGGGSALGVAKAVARTTGLPIVAVPTTYAGSEMTPIWGLTANGAKTTGRDLAVLPRTVIYDPELTLTLPPAASGASGMNAVAHCVEALWTDARNPVTDAIATEAIGLLAMGLRGSVADPGDLESRSQALRGAWLGGAALAQGGTGLHHKICHVLGGRFDLPHADVHAAVLPWVVDHFRAAAPDALTRVAQTLHADDAVAGLQRLAADLGVNRGLRDLGLDDAGADEAADAIVAVAPAVPGPVTRQAVRAILERAMDTVPADTAQRNKGAEHG